ncbi:MAG: Pyrimidine monooxygenase RutA [Candidatus Heimdallarchaeota archaeon LC_2]|nr:MAG: Pyrimidine monooxygenase RutA [Candidatus Heimdallarchaeota archaeon LC_2]
MKLGVYIHGSSPFNPKVTFDEYSQLAIFYENAGVETLWFADHLIRTPDPNESPLFETWSLIAGLSTITETIKFGTMVSPVTFRNIGLFAKMISTIDHMSNGRIIVGLGSGWYEKEHEMFDLQYPDLKTRSKLLEDSIEALIQLWTSPNKVNFQSDSFTLKNAYLNPKPIQKPHPPILIGGGGEKITLLQVAKYAQMSNFSGNIETIKHKLTVLKNHCSNIGRNYDEIIPTINMAAVIGKNQGEVEIGVEQYRDRFLQLGMTPPSLSGFADNRLVGTPEQIGEQIDKLKIIGVKEINITINDKTSEKYLPEVIKLYS